MECLVCKKTRRKVFNINLRCGSGQNTIKDDILEFVGDSVPPSEIDDHLNDTQHVCNIRGDICMNMLDDIVKNKYNVLEAIFTQQNEQKCIPNLAFPPSREATPTPLLFISRTKPYNETQEKMVERREALKSEEERYTIGNKNNRKGKRKSRSKSADIKRIGRQLVKSVQSEEINRPFSAVSEMSFVSFAGEDDEGHERPCFIVYAGDELIYPVKRTRSVSRLLEYNTNEQQKKKAKSEVDKLFHCRHPMCSDINFGRSLTLYTSHMVECHSCVPYYKCWTCKNEFVTRDHLHMHMKNHDIFPVLCGVCGVQQQNVATYQKHIDQHLAASFKCFLCDMAFVTKKECNNHIFSNHRRRKAYQQLEYKILKQVDYKKAINTTDDEEIPSNSDNSEKRYTFGIMKVAKDSAPVVFRGRSYPELDYLKRKRMTEPEVDIYPTGAPKQASLGDDLNFNTNLVESFTSNTLTRKASVTPSSIFRDDANLYDLRSPTISPWRRKRRRGSSGRTTPFEGSNNIPSDEDALEFDIRPFDLLTSRRDLESRNTEVAGYFAGGGDSEGDANSFREGGGRKSLTWGSDVGDLRTVADSDSDDVETETQYLDEDNRFVSSINSQDFDGDSDS